MKPLRASRLLAAFCGFAFLPCTALAGVPVSYGGGDGSSFAKAIVIVGANEDTGPRAEYSYLGRRYPGYRWGEQSLIRQKKRVYDKLDFTTASGEKKTIYFDITDFFGTRD